MDEEADDPLLTALEQQVLATLVDTLEAMTDPIERSQRARLVSDKLGEMRDRIARLRKDGLIEANDLGSSWAEIGRRIGTSAARAHQIVHGKTRPSRY